MERKLGKNYVSCYTVEDLIKVLKKLPKEKKVKYTGGGSANFGDITFVDIHYDKKFIIIGELTW